MTYNQKLDFILEYLAANQEKINLTPAFIHQELFNNEITANEAKELHATLLKSGNVRVVGNRYPAYSPQTDQFLREGGFSILDTKLNINSLNNLTAVSSRRISVGEEEKEVFLSYAWGTEEENEKVLAFNDHLRKKGFFAHMDKMLSQGETSINFVKMMHKGMHEHKKVIIILSKLYKQKAETFTGGVGSEYELMINDINDNPNKYILVSFGGRGNDIIPYGLKGRNIVDLSLDGEEEALFRLLVEQPMYIFAEVAATKPSFESMPIGSFEEMKEVLFPIEIALPSIHRGDTSAQGGLYKSIEFGLTLSFKNRTSKVIDEFAYELKFVQQLSPDSYGESVTDGHYIFTENIQKKVFPGQSVVSKSFNLKISSFVKYQIINSTVFVTVFTDQGSTTREFPANELFAVPPVNNPHHDKKALSLDMFI